MNVNLSMGAAGMHTGRVKSMAVSGAARTLHFLQAMIPQDLLLSHHPQTLPNLVK